MSITPERLAEIRQRVDKAIGDPNEPYKPASEAMHVMRELLAHIDAQQVKIVTLREALEAAGNYNLATVEGPVQTKWNRARQCCGSWGDKPHDQGCWIGKVLASTELS